MINHPSPNFNERGSGVKPSYIILHYTGMKDGAAALARLCDPAAEVSAHYVVEEDGRIFRLVDDDKRAWHAGRSWWRGQENMNAHSIGIEIVNPGHEWGYRAFPAAQMAAVAALCRDLMARHDIPAAGILAHSDIAPARKEDPGELFDWPSLAAQGIGVWPKPEAGDYKQADKLLSDVAQMKEALAAYGYDPRCELSVLMTAFARHFHPEALSAPGQGRETAARLAWLVRDFLAKNRPIP